MTPLAYGLRATDTGRLKFPNVYVKAESAETAAQARPGRYEAVPLYGPEAIAAAVAAAIEEARVARAQAEASESAERALRGEAVALRNQLATLRGRLVAEKHGHVEGARP